VEVAAPVVVALLKLALPAVVEVAVPLPEHRAPQLVFRDKAMLAAMVHILQSIRSPGMLGAAAAVLVLVAEMVRVSIILLPEAVPEVVASLLLFPGHHIVILEEAAEVRMVAQALIWSVADLAQPLSAAAQAAREVAHMPEILAP
jgi:hypothetical protein